MPGEYVKDGRIVLSVAPRAVRALELGNDVVRFAARFSGRQFNVRVPVRYVLAVYAKENGKGIALAEEDEPPEETPPESPRPSGGRPRLRLVS